MSTIVNIVVLYQYKFPPVSNSHAHAGITFLLHHNNIVETRMNNIVGPTMLLTHDNNVVQAYCSGNNLVYIISTQSESVVYRSRGPMFNSRPEALKLHFSQLVLVESQNAYLSETRYIHTS